MNNATLDQVKEFDQMLQKKLVYLVGPARGGTSMFIKLMDLSEEILVWPGVTHFINHVWRYRNKIHLRLLTIIFRIPWQDKSKRPIFEQVDEEMAVWLRGQISRALSSKEMNKMWRIYPLIRALSEENTKEMEQVRCWMDKANDIESIGDIAKWFPEGKFIFVIRDPRASIYSMTTRAQKKAAIADSQADFNMDTVRYCIYWRRILQRMLLFIGRYPDRARIVRYEDFVEDPTTILNNIFSFLGLEKVPHDQLQSRLDGVSYSATNNPDEKGKGISTKPLTRWKTGLSEEGLKMISAITGSVAAKVGYDITPTDRQKAYWFAVRLPGYKNKLLNGLKLGYLDAQSVLLKKRRLEE